MFDALALVAPRSCVSCGCAADAPLCAGCASCVPDGPRRLRSAPEGIDAVWTLGDYAGPVGGLVRAAKYAGDGEAARWLARRVEALPTVVDGIVAVPAHWTRVFTRDVEVPDVLARAVARRGAPVRRWLRRERLSVQAGRRHAERAGAARSAWRATGEAAGALLLVDDVMTTGATAAACARELRGAGARRVELLVAACGAAWS